MSRKMFANPKVLNRPALLPDRWQNSMSLNRPMLLPTSWPNETPEFREAFLGGYKISLLERLAHSYGIDDDATDRWEQLSLRLAEEFIPAFEFVMKRPRRRGRPNNRLLMQQVWTEVERLRLGSEKISIVAACKLLAQPHGKPAVTKVLRGHTAESLETLYHKANRLKARQKEHLIASAQVYARLGIDTTGDWWLDDLECAAAEE